ncbi:hypothetical protein [Streptomyces roseochromogenus]|uniref:Uncharacterized protein n=1 Tax=Streptomyces roseochromogenus subsp. oscitans DS 12.976 TaxID=1352936 RepID=V6JXI4_STRRC|nr:hypothetical protein [Streptomyces roseochromogenus]EST24398.1 hypothetical protein M878_30770 [Streptomyces roseochromogenus subsp. oscitans DS 12.976]
MGAWLWGAWLQVWPNLAANVLWVPVVGVHHWLTCRHLRALHEQQRHLHHLIEQKESEGQST